MDKEQSKIIEKEFSNFINNLLINKLKFDISEDLQDNFCLENTYFILLNDLEEYIEAIKKANKRIILEQI